MNSESLKTILRETPDIYFASWKQYVTDGELDPMVAGLVAMTVSRKEIQSFYPLTLSCDMLASFGQLEKQYHMLYLLSTN